jgi:Domain of unknown function (DUF4845)
MQQLSCSSKFLVNPSAVKRRQLGLSFTGLIFLMAIGIGIALFAMKVFPALAEYQAVKKAVIKTKEKVSTTAEVSRAFDLIAQVDNITSVTGKDLAVVKTSDGVEISFDYQKKLELFGPASLLLEFQGSTRKK